MSLSLKPCPFCGEKLFVRAGANQWAHCDTEGCWANRSQVVALDDPSQVAAWNRRAEGRPSPEGEKWTARLEVQRADKVWEVRLATYAAGSTVPRLGEVLAGPFDARDAATNWIQNNRAALSTPSPQRAEGAPAGEVKEVLEMTGLRTVAEVIDMANVGQSLMERIADLVKQEGPFKDWTPADDPAEIVFDLVDHYEEVAALSRPSQVGKEEANQIGAAEAEVGRYVYQRIERLMDAKSGTPESAELDYLTDIVTHVEEYGEEACADHPMGSPPAPSPEAGREEGEPARKTLSADLVAGVLPGNTSLTNFTDFRCSHDDLERVVEAAYKRGWSDREDDIIERAERLSPPAPEPDLFAGNAKKPEPGYEAEPVAQWIERVAEAMQDTWNDICSDTGCHPLDLTQQGRSLFFQPRHWAEHIARRLYVSPVPVAISRDELEEVRSLLAGVKLGATRNRFNEPAHYVEGLDEVREALDAILQRLSNQQGGGR